MYPDFDEILNELSFRVGIPDLSKESHKQLLVKLLRERDIPSAQQLADRASVVFQYIVENTPKPKRVLKEEDIVKNRETGNIYKVKERDPSKHDIPTPAEIAKAEKDNGGELPTQDKSTTSTKQSEPKQGQKLSGSDFQSSAEKDTEPSAEPTPSKSKKLTPRQQEITQSLNNGDFSELVKASDEVNAMRDRGIAGAGGSVASYGESGLTRAANNLKGDGYTKWKETNKEAIEVEKKNILSKEKANAKKIQEVSKQLGYKLPEDKEKVIEYLAERKVYGDLELERLKANPDSLWYNEGTKGFNQPTEEKKEMALRKWADAQFDGAHATIYEVENSSNIDTSQPYYVIQSNPKEGGADAAILSHLQDKYEEAKKSGNEEDAAHYEQEIRAFEKLGFHDTMAIGKDKNGRTTVLHITNKKADNLKDMWANTTPEYMLNAIKKSFGPEVSEKVISIADEGIVKCADGKQATNRAFASMKMDENFVKITETEEMQSYMNTLRKDKKFDKWAKSNGVNLETASNAEVLAAAQQYMKSEEAKGKTVSYTTFGKVLTKIGEFGQDRKLQQKYPDIDFNSESIALAVKNKNDEKDLVGAVHRDIVNEISEADKEKGFPDKDGNNGPHTQAYIATAMHSMHFDLMVENFDKSLSAVTGIRGSRPEDFRGCLAELSGFEGDINSKEGRNQLNQHLLKKCKINATTGYIEITSPNGNVSLVEDSWRTSGESKKVEKKLGDGLSQCIASKVDSRKSRK